MRSRIIAGGIVALCLTLTGTTAQAEGWRHRDARHDAVAVRQDGSSVDPSNTSADITRLVVRHTAHAVLVELYLRDLEPAGYANGVVRLQTPRRTYQALAYHSPDAAVASRLTVRPSTVVEVRGAPATSLETTLAA